MAPILVSESGTLFHEHHQPTVAGFQFETMNMMMCEITTTNNDTRDVVIKKPPSKIVYDSSATSTSDAYSRASTNTLVFTDDYIDIGPKELATYPGEGQRVIQVEAKQKHSRK
jgi:hypothetical protein